MWGKKSLQCTRVADMNGLAFIKRHQYNVFVLAFTSDYLLLNVLRWIILFLCGTKVISEAGADIFLMEPISDSSVSR